jgi:hypothetical protein
MSGELPEKISEHFDVSLKVLKRWAKEEKILWHKSWSELTATEKKRDTGSERRGRILGGNCKSLPVTYERRGTDPSTPISDSFRRGSRFTNGDIHLYTKNLN